MLINKTNLDTVFNGFKTLFNEGLGQAESHYLRISTQVTSGGGEEKYGWLKDMPGVREWLGDRHVHSLALGDYEIKNKDFELTIAVPRNAVKDDTYGTLSPRFRAMGEAVAAHREQLVFNLLCAGFTTACYDGQYFFDTDHPVLNKDGVEVSTANTDGGSGEPWFLIDDRKALKPLIYQLREEFAFTSRTDWEDEHVFMKNEFLYGTNGRSNVGFGFWQVAWGSKQTLSTANYAAARAAMMKRTGDYGRKLGIKPRLLVVGPDNEEAALEIVNAENLTSGATNVWKGTAELLVVPWIE
jgi:phage major head subunit gpT-like protein